MQGRDERVRVGIGGWEHEVLNRTFYPRSDLSSAQKLEWYAQVFDTVEIRSTFWDATLGATDAREWAEAVAGNREFRFQVKLHSAFTHKGVIQPEPLRRIRALSQELAARERLGSVLAQFPYSFTNTSANRFHLVKLGELMRGFPLHAELRHQSWNIPGLPSLLADAGFSPVSADLPRIRQFMPFSSRVVGDPAYLRLHGRNDKGWLLNGMDTRYEYLYNPREIQELRRRLEAVSNSCTSIFLIFNNTTGGKAVANALQMLSAIRDGSAVRVPPATATAFPFLKTLGHFAPGSESLFDTPTYRAAM